MKFGSRQMVDNVIDIDNLDQKIYRIFSIDRFKQLISTNEMTLVNPLKWDDPFENFFLRANAIDENGTPVGLERIAERWYGQCWTFCSESDAMWRIYSPNKDGVRISSTVRKLFSCLWNDGNSSRGLSYFIGSVSYKPRLEIEEFMEKHSFWDMAIGGQNNNFAELLCIKRTEFTHEKEVRLLVNDSEGDKGDNGCYPVQFDYRRIFNDVCLDPRLNHDEYDKAKKDIENLGCTLPIEQSELYRVNLLPIRLQ